MIPFYVTFGQQYPREPHPMWKDAHRDGYVIVSTPDMPADAAYNLARTAVIANFGSYWSMLYDYPEFTTKIGLDSAPINLFPLGALAEIRILPGNVSVMT